MTTRSRVSGLKWTWLAVCQYAGVAAFVVWLHAESATGGSEPMVLTSSALRMALGQAIVWWLPSYLGCVAASMVPDGRTAVAVMALAGAAGSIQVATILILSDLVAHTPMAVEVDGVSAPALAAMACGGLGVMLGGILVQLAIGGGPTAVLRLHGRRPSVALPLGFAWTVIVGVLGGLAAHKWCEASGALVALTRAG